METLADRDIKFLKGVGPKRAELLASEAGIRSVLDLLQYYPTHYIDRSRTYPISELRDGMAMTQVRGRFVSFTVQGEGARSRLTGLFTDGRNTMEVVWFRQIRKLRELYVTGKEYIIFGKPGYFAHTLQMVHPEVDDPAAVMAEPGLRGVYPLTDKLRNAGFSSRTFHTLARNALALTEHIADPVPPSILATTGLMPLGRLSETSTRPRLSMMLPKHARDSSLTNCFCSNWTSSAMPQPARGR